jgi:hypothetical protein
MSKAKYQNMNLDELFTELCAIRVKVHEMHVSGAPIGECNKLAKVGNEIFEEIESRGESSRPYYLGLLKSDVPVLRLTGALNARDYAPELAVPVLEELNHGKWGGTIRMNASMTLNGMRRRGEIPPKP